MTGMRRAIVVGIVSAVVATNVPAQQPAVVPQAPLQITLQEAVRRALDVQPAMIQARGVQRNAGASSRSAWGAFLPTVTTNASASRSNTSTFRSGTTDTLPPTYSYSGGLSASLVLFDGFARFANVASSSATLDAAGAGLVNQRYQVTAATAQVFFTALADEELVRVAQAQVDRAKEELQIAVNKFQAGAATRSDTLTATVDLGTARLGLLQAQANLATAQANLGRQVGVDQLVRAVPDSAFPPLPDTTTLRASALSSAPLVRQADAQASAARAQVWSTRSLYWPSVTLSYSNTRAGVGSPLLPLFNGYPESFTWRFGLSWTLFNGFSREQSQVSASVARDNAEAQAADARRQVNALYTQQLAATSTAWAQIQIAGADIVAATEAARVQQERYRLGAGTLLDLLTAQANLTQAAVSQVQARYNYLIARAQLEAIVGHTL
jgi:outer membrane protein TolC